MNSGELINEPHPFYNPHINQPTKSCCKKVLPIVIFISLNGLSYVIGYYMATLTGGKTGGTGSQGN